MATITDHKTLVLDNGFFSHYEAVVVSATDYYPFGWEMPGRKIEGEYRFGFNGKENDTEWSKQDFNARIYDGRVGRWLSMDPMAGKYPNMSPFAGFGGNPILLIDKNGEENAIYLVITKAGRKANPDLNLATVATIANKVFDNLGLNTKVFVIDESHYSSDKKFNEFSNGMPTTDRIVVIGENAYDVMDFLQHSQTNFEQSNALFQPGGKKEKFGTNKNNPEVSVHREYGTTIKTEGDPFDYEFIAVAAGLVNNERNLKYKEENGQIRSLKPEEFTAFLILHGTGHNANLDHSAKPNHDKTISTGNYNTLDIMISGASANSNYWKGEVVLFNDITKADRNENYIEAVKNIYGNKKAVNKFDPD